MFTPSKEETLLFSVYIQRRYEVEDCRLALKKYGSTFFECQGGSFISV